MINKKHLNLRFQLVSFFVLLAAMIFAGLYPFNFSPPNRLNWIPNEPGLYFDGAGIAFTNRIESMSLKKAVSVELLLKERLGSRNWGPKEIFSFYDRVNSPSFLVGQWAGHIFIYSRFEKNKGHKWYRLFRTRQRFPRGQPHLVTVTFDKNEMAIYIDGQLSNKKNVALTEGNSIQFSESFLLGNSPRGKNGWRGEIKGLAIYNRILLPDEAVTHSRIVMQKGVRGLAEATGCLALYPFDERKGETAKSILNKPHPFIIPKRLNTLSLNMSFLPFKDMRFYGFNKADFIKNIVFFIPFGILLSAIILKKYSTGYLTTFLIVTLAGGSLSGILEAFQLFLPTRYSGIADILSNILGSGFGMFVTIIILKKKSLLGIKGNDKEY